MSNSYQGRSSSPLHIYYLSSTGHDHKKKNHSKNCDISNLCIELVVKEMSQRDLWSRGAAALLRECYPAAGGVLCPPLGLCGQTPSTKLSNMGATLSATLDVCRPLIKIHYNFLQSLVQEAVRQPHIDHIHMTNTLEIYVLREALF